MVCAARGFVLGALLLALGGCLQQASDKDFDFDNDNDPTTTEADNVELVYVDQASEVVILGNFSGVDVIMTNWTLVDDEEGAPVTYTFPEFTLANSAIVYIKNGSDADTATTLYAGSGFFAWSAGDTALLKNASGIQIDACTQPSDCFP
jgi:hypothetical protein